MDQEAKTHSDELLPDSLIDLALGTFKGQIFATALDLGVFDYLGREQFKPLSEICQALNINCRVPEDYFDAMAALGLVDRKDKTFYRNSEKT